MLCSKVPYLKNIYSPLILCCESLAFVILFSHAVQTLGENMNLYVANRILG